MKLTKAEARRYLLCYQGLYPPRRLDGKEGILAFLKRVGCIQYDPVDAVGQNSLLVLQSRVRGFRPEMLWELLYEDRKLVDGYDKLMSIYPVEDYPYFRRRREQVGGGWRMEQEPVREAMEKVLRVIEERGPLSSLELGMNDKVDWYWTSTRVGRAALESLYLQGDLVVHHRAGTRRYFDLAARWLPEEILNAPEPNPTVEQYQDWYVQRRIGSVGMIWNRAGEAWLGMGKITSKERARILARLVEQGKVLEVSVEGVRDGFYMRSGDLPLLEEALAQGEIAPEAAFLAPLDNLLWDRKLLATLFGFDYTWEIYVPEKKRRYGYYVLPVLYGDRMAARFEPVRSKKNGNLTIKNWWWEPDFTADEDARRAVDVSLREFMGYLGVQRVTMGDGVGLEWLRERYAS